MILKIIYNNVTKEKDFSLSRIDGICIRISISQILLMIIKTILLQLAELC
jgi:hypothetical protein